MNSYQAVIRFGLGAKPGETSGAAGDPRGWLLAQIAGYRPVSPAQRTAGWGLTREWLAASAPERAVLRKRMRAHYVAACAERFHRQMDTPSPFLERLVIFWSNHFTVSTRRGAVQALVKDFEDQAIRRHVTGRFRDMLLASTRHPAMLEYLDNRRSFGPNSFQGRWKTKGLNENRARELLELHTLGADAGYTQADVESLARILTGWSFKLDPYTRDLLPSFAFQPSTHEPGSKRLLGREIEPRGEDEGVEALTMLADHPATARHLAHKLAVHFIADRPPAGAVERLARVFRTSDGDLSAIANAITTEDAAWRSPLSKVKTPYELVVSAARLLGQTPEPERLQAVLNNLNYSIFGATSPAGHSDRLEHWAGPDAMVKRLGWASATAHRADPDAQPRTLAETALGPLLSGRTASAIRAAPSRGDGLALLLASPEFQRR